MMRVVAVVALAMAQAAGLGAQPANDYLGLVNQYASGDANLAITQLASWQRLIVAESVHRSTAKLQPQLRAAAAMLHTDVALVTLDSLPALSGFHLETARRLLKNLGNRPEFLQWWYELVSTMYASRGSMDEALAAVREGLSRFPRDAALHVTSGVLIEMRLSFVEGDLQGLPRVHIGSRRELTAAAAEYRQALEIDSELSPAWLRLGWVHFLLQDERASGEIAAALDRATDTRTRYLAHLFLGAVAEREGRLLDARREYEAARDAGVTYQTPYVAISRIEEALGHHAMAHEVAEAWASLPRTDDPWWDHHLGGVDRSALAWLHQEARHP
jgi:tetratricopeptide (TPR) repeat protein